MSDGGARGVRGPSVARAKWLAVILTLVFAVAIVPQLATPPAAAQAGSDPWWGPTSRQSPTEGWAIRVPVVVENTFDYRLPTSVVSVDLDFGQLLVDAGWTSQLLGTERRLRGFTLDEDSIRVVEYGSAFAQGPRHGSTTEPVPHHFYTSPFHAEKHRDYDPSRNPSGTLLFVMKEGLAPGEKRNFYVYANPLEYGKKEPAVFKLEERAPLDAYLWGTSGTVFYGWEPQQDDKTNRILVLPLVPNQRTKVTLYERDFGKFVPAQASAQSKNPQQAPQDLQGGGFSFFVPGGKAWKIEASHPVRVVGHGKLTSTGSTAEMFGFVPSESGSFAGRTFLAYGFQMGANSAAPYVAMKSGPGTVNVRVNNMPVATLTNAQPLANIPVVFGAWNSITSDGSILLQAPGNDKAFRPDDAFAAFQVPALSGGPSGTGFYFALPRDGGFVRVCPEDYAGIRIVDRARPDFSAIPEGTRESTPPHLLKPRAGCHEYEATPTMPQLLEAYAIGEEARYPVENAPVPFRVFVGADDREKGAMNRGMVGHYGGLRAVDFHASGNVGIFGVFNNTRVTIFEDLKTGGSTNFTFTLSADDFRAFPFPETITKSGRVQIVANKPISVASTDPYGSPYARVVPGVPLNPHVKLGLAEFRGPLVELRSPETDGRQLYRSTGPATPITFRLEALNLGRWIAGESLQDSISIHCTGPVEWDIAGCGREFSVGSGNAERFDVTVTPSADDKDSTSFIDIEARSATPGIVSKFRLAIYVEVRYGVGLWFDVENGRKTIDPVVGVDPGETHSYAVLIKNTGSGEDTFTLTVDDPKEGWTQRLHDQGDDVTEVALAGGASRILTFEVTAPNLETAPQNLVSITAESVSSDLASAKDIVNTATRIRPKINIALDIDPPTRVAEPNETAQFNLTVTNRGNDVFTIFIREDSVIPVGWTTDLGLPDGEVSLNPNGNYTFPFFVTPPAGARAGDLVTVKLSAHTDAGGGGGLIPGDEVSAVTVVKRIHNITSPPLLDARADPGTKLRYVLPLENNGNGDDVIELLPGAAREWLLRAAGDQTLVLGLDDSGDFPLEIEVPRGALPGLHNVTVTLRLSREATQTITIPVDVRAVAKVDMRGPTRLEMAPARPTVLDLDVENVGNLPGNFTFGAQMPEGWNVTYAPATAFLQPGQRTKVAATLNVSREAPDGDYGASLVATTDSGASAADRSLTVLVARPKLSITNVETSGDLAVGEVIIVAATVKNDGGIAAEEVRVALLVDGEQVDQVTLGRVPVGQSQVATLNWLATRRGADVRVVIDPQEEMVLLTREETDATVNFGSKLGIPTASPLAALAMLGVAALALRRRR